MPNNNLLTKLDHTVKSFECGPDSNLRIHNLFLLMQETAYISAENLGFGYSKLKEGNMAWVLSSQKIKFNAFPKWTDEITVESWPCGYNRLMGFRDYAVKAKDGKALMISTSEWLAIDVKSRRPANINDFEIELPNYGERALDEKLSRLNPKRFGEGEDLYEVKVPHSAIDENGHVNNAEYVKWSLDGLILAQINISNISSLQVSFISELFENQKCKLLFKRENESEVLVWGLNADSNDYVFALKIKC